MSPVEDATSQPHRWRVAAGLLSTRQRLVFGLATAARITVGLCDIAVAAATYWLFQLLQQRGAVRAHAWLPHTVFEAALLTSILVVVRAAADIASSRAVFGWIQDLHRDLLLRLTRGYSEMQWTRFVSRNRSELLHHTIYSAREAADFYHRSIEMIAGIAIIGAMAAALIEQNAKAALVFALGVACLYGLHRMLLRKTVQHAAFCREVSLTRLQKIMSGVFSSAKEIRSYGLYPFFRRRIQQEAEVYALNHRRALLLPQFSRIVVDQGAALLFLGAVVVVAAQRGDTRQLLSLLAFYFVLSRRLIPLVSQLSLITGQMHSSFENVRRIEEELNQCRASRAAVVRAQLPRPGFALELDQVTFGFDQDKPLLRGINFSLRTGEVAVVCGASGLGKTSLLNLIAGVLEPVEGTVRVDRSSIGFVPQEVVLLDDTVRNNLLFGLDPRRDEELLRALAMANLADFVLAQPEGLDTQVGDNGDLLSGGQRQRLGLARALLRGPRLLLLDEATTGLDAENERQVLANLSRCGAATLLVTHHAHLHLLAHRVYRLNNGTLTEDTVRTEDEAGAILVSQA